MKRTKHIYRNPGATKALDRIAADVKLCENAERDRARRLARERELDEAEAKKRYATVKRERKVTMRLSILVSVEIYADQFFVDPEQVVQAVRERIEARRLAEAARHQKTLTGAARRR